MDGVVDGFGLARVARCVGDGDGDGDGDATGLFAGGGFGGRNRRVARFPAAAACDASNPPPTSPPTIGSALATSAPDPRAAPRATSRAAAILAIFHAPPCNTAPLDRIAARAAASATFRSTSLRAIAAVTSPLEEGLSPRAIVPWDVDAVSGCGISPTTSSSVMPSAAEMAAAATCGRMGSWPPTMATAKASLRLVVMVAASVAGTVTGRVMSPPSPAANPAPKFAADCQAIIDSHAACISLGVAAWRAVIGDTWRSASSRAPSSMMSGFPLSATRRRELSRSVALDGSSAKPRQKSSPSLVERRSAVARATSRWSAVSSGGSSSASSSESAPPSVPSAPSAPRLRSVPSRRSASAAALACRRRNFAARRRFRVRSPSGRRRSASSASARRDSISRSTSSNSAFADSPSHETAAGEPSGREAGAGACPPSRDASTVPTSSSSRDARDVGVSGAGWTGAPAIEGVSSGMATGVARVFDVALVAETIEWIERDGGANAPSRLGC